MKISHAALAAALAAVLFASGCGGNDKPAAGGPASDGKSQETGPLAQLRGAYENAKTVKLEPGECYALSGGNNKGGDKSTDPQYGSLCLKDGVVTATKDTSVSEKHLSKLPLRKECANRIPEGVDAPSKDPEGAGKGIMAKPGGFLCVADDTGSSVVFIEKPDERGVVDVHVAVVSARGPLGG